MPKHTDSQKIFFEPEKSFCNLSFQEMLQFIRVSMLADRYFNAARNKRQARACVPNAS
jgi:hypothetical protein